MTVKRSSSGGRKALAEVNPVRWVICGMLTSLLGCFAVHPQNAAAPLPELGADAGLGTDAGFVVAREDAGPMTDAEAVTRADRGPEASPPPELCNGMDDDGDGKYDEGCPLLLTRHATLKPTYSDSTQPQLDGGRVIWPYLQDGVYGLWTARLPNPEPEFVVAPTTVLRASLDGDRIVYSNYDDYGYTIIDLLQGTEMFVAPLDPEGLRLTMPALEGDYLAYSQDMGGCCENTGLFVRDLETGEGWHLADQRNAQTAPLLSGNIVIWRDDRLGYHRDEWGLDHWYDVMASKLPYVAGEFDNLTGAAPRTTNALGFEAGRVLLGVFDSSEDMGLETYRLVDLVRGEDVPMDWMVSLGDVPLDVSKTHLLVRRDPLVRCRLEVGDLETRATFEIDTQGQCPERAWIDGHFVLWARTIGAEDLLYWMDISDLVAAAAQGS